MLVQSEIARTESGVDPATTDPAGFRQRCARRIALGRTWIWREGQRLIFKVEIVAYTPGAIYLEGVWVNPTERGKNYGFRCITQVSRKLLKQTDSLCVLVNENNLKAHKFYRRAGFRPRGSYQSVYLECQPEAQKA